MAEYLHDSSLPAQARKERRDPFMKKVLLPLLALTCIAVWTAFGAEVKTDYSHSVDFSQYHT